MTFRINSNPPSPPFRIEIPGTVARDPHQHSAIQKTQTTLPLPPSRQISSIFDDQKLFALRGWNKKLSLDVIEQSQSGLRHDNEFIENLRRDLERDGRFRAPLQFNYFHEDGRIFLRDGHHRLALLREVKRTFLTNEGDTPEYHINALTYSLYQSVKFVLTPEGQLDLALSWLTPFDPRTHCRRPNIRAFKSFIGELAQNGMSYADLNRWIHQNSADYLIPLNTTNETK